MLRRTQTGKLHYVDPEAGYHQSCQSMLYYHPRIMHDEVRRNLAEVQAVLVSLLPVSAALNDSEELVIFTQLNCTEIFLSYWM